MFGKISHHHVKEAFNKAKGLVGHAYHQTKNFLNHVDHGFKVAKHIYHAVSPIIDKYANQHSNTIHHNVNKAINGYENIRNKVIEGDNDIKKVRKSLMNV